MSPERILVFETSALLATLSQFTDPHTHSPVALERLLQTAPGQRAPVDRIVIPDHVFYELSGLLPVCFPEMQRKLAAAQNDPKALDRVIDLYVLASPRGEVNDPRGEQKSHIRVLLKFIAQHPDSLVRTDTSEAYCRRLMADYNGLSSNGDSLKRYCPTFADAFAHLDKQFQSTGLRIHAGQLRMMGLLSEDEYNERLDRPETPLSKQQRFFLKGEMLDRLGRKIESPGTKPEQALLTPGFIEKMKKQEEGIKDTKYATIGFFRRHPKILQLARERYESPSIREERTQWSDEQWLQQALGPSRLLMEHYLYGGIIPPYNPSLLIAAQTLGFDTAGLSKNSDSDVIRRHLYNQGFFEVTPDLEQLNRIAAGLKAEGIASKELDDLIQAIPQAGKQQQTRFNAACSTKGIVPYEKVFSDGLVNGAIEWPQFWKLVTAVDGLHHQNGGYIGSKSGDILVKPGATPDQSAILIRQDGFTSRAGLTVPDRFISHASRSVHLAGKQGNYYELPAMELVKRCRAGRLDHKLSSRLYRVFEAMLYPPIARDAVDVRNEARGILGDERVVQLEKDFANRHARKSRKVEPPYRSLFSSLHVNGRLMRKNLGEVATLEVAAAEMDQYPNAHVWLINHDSDLFPTKPSKGDIQLEDAIVRQHSGLWSGVRQLNERVAGNGHLHLVPTAPQFLNDMQVLMGGQPRSEYEGVKAKQIITQHRSTSWSDTVAQDMAAQRHR